MNVLRRAAAPAQETCEICGVSIAGGHGHLVDRRDRRLLCACRPCYLLFVPEGAAQGRYRAVGERYARLDSNVFDGPDWDALQIPIGLAFFFYDSSVQRVVGFYPAAAGATESELPLGAWERIASAQPLLAGMRPDVEAVLVNHQRGESVQAYLVPIDTCYELIGTLRTHWQGFDGGDAVREHVEELFCRIRERAT
jgi:Family of unknown function (DUF5947)